MADIVRLRLENTICNFDFDKKRVDINRNADNSISVSFSFSDITDVEYRAPKFLMPGVFGFIIKGERLVEKIVNDVGINVSMVSFTKKDTSTVIDVLNRLVKVCNLSGLKGWNSINAPMKIYTGSTVNEQPKEYRIKCNVCGKVFCYSEEDIRRNEELQSKAKTIRREGVTQTLFTSQITGNQSLSRAQQVESQIMDYSKCPNCGSIDLTELSEEEFKAAQAPAAQAAPASSPMDELKKLKELLDMGIVTQEEFDAKKKQLLGL